MSSNLENTFFCFWLKFVKPWFSLFSLNHGFGMMGLQQFYRNHQWSPVIPPQNWPLVVSLNSDSSQLYSHDKIFDFSMSQIVTDLYILDFLPPKNVLPFFLDLGWVSKSFSRHTQHYLHGHLSNSVKAASIATRAMMVRESGSEVKRYEKTANQPIIFGAFKRKHVCSVECLGTYIFQDKRGVGDNHPAEWWWLDYLFWVLHDDSML